MHSTKNLLGGLYSSDELIIDRVKKLWRPFRLASEKFDMEFHWGKCVSYISDQIVYIGNEEEYEADLVFI